MIKELYQYWTTPCSPAARKLGYLKELIAIDARSKRVAPYWQDHLDKTCEVIIEAQKQCRNFDKAVILGAGLLLDIPLALLADKFKEVILVDIVQPKSFRKIREQFPNVAYLQHDVTGVVSALLSYKYGDVLPIPDDQLPATLQNADFLASVNLLSQLSIIPYQELLKKGCCSKKINEWCANLISAHLKQLNKVSGRVCLITDTQHQYINKAGCCIEERDMIMGVSLPVPDSQWDWVVAPFGEAYRKKKVVAKVFSWCHW